MEPFIAFENAPQKKPVDILHKYFEIILMFPFVLLFIGGVVILDYAVIPISSSGLGKGFSRYVIPIMAAVILQTYVLAVFKLLRRKNLGLSFKETLISFLYVPYCILCFYLSFTFKAWMPLVNSNSYDALLYSIDRIIAPLPELFSTICIFLDRNEFCSSIYSFIYFSMFLVSIVCHSLFDNFVNYRRVVLGMCCILLFGSISYWIMPALGPFIYEATKLSGFTENQLRFLYMYNDFVFAKIMPNDYFGLSLAAMPSLHVAFSLFFLLSAKKSLPALTILYVPFFVLINLIAVASKWHYALDLVVGGVLAILIYKAMQKIIA